MSVFRRRLAGPAKCSRVLQRVQSAQGLGPTGFAVDPANRVYLQLGWGGDFLAYLSGGLYDGHGALSLDSSIRIQNTQDGDVPFGLRIDPLINAWFVGCQYSSYLAYGTYNPATGAPTLGGYLSTGLPNSYGAGIAIDPNLRLWWMGSDQTAQCAYGTYDGSGVPTKTGIQTPPTGSGIANALTCDYMRQLLWIMNRANVLAYDSNGVLTATTTPAINVAQADIDFDRSIMAAYAGPNLTIYDLAADGELAAIDSISSEVWSYPDVAVDSGLGLIWLGNGESYSYCK